MIDHERTHAIRYLALSHLASELHRRVAEQKPPKPTTSFSVTEKIVNKLGKSIQVSEDFWRQQNQQLQTDLDAWVQYKKEPELLPGIPAATPDSSLPDDINWKESYLISLSGFKAAHTLLGTIEIDLEEFEWLLEIKASRPAPAIEAQLFQNEAFTPIPTADPMVSSIAAQLRKDLWRTDSNGTAQFRQQARTSPKNYIEHYITTPGDITMLPWEAAEQIIDKFGFSTVKLHLIFAAHTMHQAEPWKSSFTLKASDIVRELGWDRRTDLLLSQKLNEVAKAAYILDCLLVKAVWIEGRGKNSVDASTPTGRVWNVLIDLHGQLTLGGEINQPREVYITIQPGLWTQHFLNKAGGTAKEALYQFGWLAQEILKMDPYHDELALRLAIHLTTDSRFHLSGQYQVGSLLEAIQPKTVIDGARTDRRKAYDFKQNWDSALKLLMQLGWQIEFDPETYPELLRPDSEARKPRGYIDKLLAADITIRQPTPLPELVAARVETLKAQVLPPVAEPSLTAAQIKQGIKTKGWNQAQLAGFLGVSQPFVSQLVNGRRPITPELEARLKELLPLPE